MSWPALGSQYRNNLVRLKCAANHALADISCVAMLNFADFVLPQVEQVTTG
jgi:hypothetical protein